MRYTVLIAEDDPDIVDLLTLYMDNQDFYVLRACDGETALDYLRHTRIDIALVDLMMPKMSGYEFIREARKVSNIPVIILSAKNEDTDKVKGLNIGADAYLTKPFNPFEVIANLKALLRRYYELGAGQTGVKSNQILSLGGLELETDSFTLRKNGKIVPLTSSEYKIMAKLMYSPGRIFTRSQLYECIGGDYYESDDSTVMVHISNIRAKIEDEPSHPGYIKTVRGLGYKIEGK